MKKITLKLVLGISILMYFQKPILANPSDTFIAMASKSKVYTGKYIAISDIKDISNLCLINANSLDSIVSFNITFKEPKREYPFSYPNKGGKLSPAIKNVLDKIEVGTIIFIDEIMVKRKKGSLITIEGGKKIDIIEKYPSNEDAFEDAIIYHHGEIDLLQVIDTVTTFDPQTMEENMAYYFRSDTVYIQPEQNAFFKQGKLGLENYINSNIPKTDKHSLGTNISFIIFSSGYIGYIKIEKSSDDTPFDKKAMRIIEDMNNGFYDGVCLWTPAMEKGKPVSAYVKLEVK